MNEKGSVGSRAEKRSAVKWKKKKRGETRREIINEEISEALKPAEL